jgi:hypothetical protein
MKKLGFFALGIATIGLYSCSSENATEEQNAEVYQLIVDNSDIYWFGDYIKDGNLDHSHEGELLFKRPFWIVTSFALILSSLQFCTY